MNRKPCGFTLLEMSIVLVIIGVMLAGGAMIFSAAIASRYTDETNMKLAALQKALLNYRRAFNRLPCPADATLDNNAATNNYFGIEAALWGDCSGTPGANFHNGGNTIHKGMAPVRTLGLPDDYAFDGWGRRILYAVERNFTITDAFSFISITDVIPRITVNATMTGPVTKTNLAAYVIFSTGEDGQGSYPRKGNNARTIDVSIGDADELQNCHCDNVALTDKPFDGVFVQKLYTRDATDRYMGKNFDDIVLYATRADLRGYNE